MKEANEENENEEYITENPTLEDIVSFIEDTYLSSSDGKVLVDEIGLQDEIVEQLVDEFMDNFSDAEDYIQNMFGNNTEDYLSQIEGYVDMYALAKDIVEDMDTYELKNYI